MSKKRIVVVISIVLVIVLVISQVSQSTNLSDIKGKFERVAFVRNENNLEKILKIYAVSVGDVAQANYLEYGNAIPHNAKSGETIIYFFDKKENFPTQLSLQAPHFDTAKYKAIAVYTKNETNDGKLTFD